jgi:hypothetical protein
MRSVAKFYDYEGIYHYSKKWLCMAAINPAVSV